MSVRTATQALRFAYLSTRALWEKTLDLLLAPRNLEISELTISPPFCAKCFAHFDGIVHESQTCPNCREMHWKFRKARAAYPMIGDIRNAIINFKYHSQYWLRVPLSEVLYQAYIEHYSHTSYIAIVPIPLSVRRRYWRGFNQASELARLLAKKIRVPYRNWLIRCKDTQKQARLSRKQRIRNVRNIFEYIGPNLKYGGEILLVDDVLTTGSTASSCAEVLLQAGATAVDVLTITRA